MSVDYASSVHLQSALSVAHDFVDAIAQLRSELKIAQDQIDVNARSYQAILEERERQIAALIAECANRDQTIATDTNAVSALEAKLTILSNDNEVHKNTIRELKGLITVRDAEIANLNAEIESMRTPVVTIEKAKAARKKL